MAVFYKIFESLKVRLQVGFPRSYGCAEKHKDKVKFVIAGATAAGTNFTLLILLHGVLEFDVVASAVAAFIVSFFVSFFLQKFWTFRDNRRDVIYRQMFFYVLVALVGIAATAAGIRVLVVELGVFYVLAQAMIGVCLAVGNFLVYKTIIFRERK
ncbi:MAG: GtrA family protein [Candidatus Falkowbacteria bacterium]